MFNDSLLVDIPNSINCDQIYLDLDCNSQFVNEIENYVKLKKLLSILDNANDQKQIDDALLIVKNLLNDLICKLWDNIKKELEKNNYDPQRFMGIEDISIFPDLNQFIDHGVFSLPIFLIPKK